MLSIRSNIAALTAQRGLAASQVELDRSLARLSSGDRITSSFDDAAGLGVSVNLAAQIRGLEQASRNAGDGLSIAQTAEGALNEVSNLLTRLGELASQSASDGVTAADRTNIQTEVTSILAELDAVDARTEFNGTTLFGASPFSFLVGLRNTPNDVISLNLSAVNVDSANLGVNGVDLGVDAATSATFIDTINTAITNVSAFRAQIGATANRLTSARDSIASANLSLAAAESNIRDVDVAAETSRLSQAQILVQAATAVLAQANIAPSVALKLLQ